MKSGKAELMITRISFIKQHLYPHESPFHCVLDSSTPVQSCVWLVVCLVCKSCSSYWSHLARRKKKQVNTKWRMWEWNSNPGFASWESEQPQWACAAGTRSPQPAVLVWMTRDWREESMQTTQQWEFKGEKEERNKRIDLRSSSRPFSLSGDVNEVQHAHTHKHIHINKFTLFPAHTAFPQYSLCNVYATYFVDLIGCLHESLFPPQSKNKLINKNKQKLWLYLPIMNLYLRMCLFHNYLFNISLWGGNTAF